MKKLLALLCVLGLIFGFVSAASASPYTTSLFLDGWACYDASPLTSEPYLSGEIEYDFVWDIPDFGTTYSWSLGIDVWAEGFYKNGAGFHEIDESLDRTFPLGSFALADIEDEIWAVKDFIENLPNPGSFPPLEYRLDGDWDEGILSFWLYEPILEGCGISMAMVEFGGQIDLNAAPVPEPATMLLLGTGLIGLAGYGRKRFKKKK